MKPITVSVLIAIWLVPQIMAQDCADLKSAISLLVRQNLESAITGRVRETFEALLDDDGTNYCASTAPDSSLPLGDVRGVPDGVSGPARCALYCQNFDGCISFNYYKKPLNDGTQCQLYTKAPNACTKSADANCQHFQATGTSGSCQSRGDFNFFPATQTYYKPIFESLTWPEAQARCKQLNPFAHLAVFRSMAEFNDLMAFLRTYPLAQVTACSTNVGFPAAWTGWWIAKRKLSDDAPNAEVCRNSPMPWVLDTKMRRLLPEQSWESSMFIPGMPDCSTFWTKAFRFEMCMSITAGRYLLNDMMCDFKMCAVCQLD